MIEVLRTQAKVRPGVARLLPESWTQGKYDVSRARLLDPRMADPRMAEGTTEVTEKSRLLDAA